MTGQLDTWKGSFGDEYIARNEAKPDVVAGKVRAFAEMLRPLLGQMPRSILEVGANIGLNLRALAVLTDAELFAVEPNETARARLVRDQVVPAARALDGTARAIPMKDGSVELAFTSTVLIHVPPADLKAALQEIHRVSSRYILCNEYFAARPETIEYRGHTDLLFKNDFGSVWMDQFPGLRLVDYGFHWRRVAAMDSTTWWLFEKPQG